MIQLLLFSLDKMMFSFFHKSTKDPLLISKPNIELISFSHSVSAEKSSQIFKEDGEQQDDAEGNLILTLDFEDF